VEAEFQVLEDSIISISGKSFLSLFRNKSFPKNSLFFISDAHTHIDNYGNYMTGYCGGLSLGDARRLDELLEYGIDLDERPILKALTESLGKLYELAVKEFNYVERADGYISECDLCLDMRRHIAQQTDEFHELAPKEFYRNLI